MVPSLVAAEYLRGFNKPERPAQMAILTERYFLAAFDAAGAAKAAELGSLERVQSLRKTGKRQVIKTDTKIIATAIVHGASTIYTANLEEYRTIAGGLIDIQEVPNVPSQSSLFDGVDDDNGE